jgi:hypothetical protein
MDTEFLSPESDRWAECLVDLDHDVYHRADYLTLEARRMGARAQAFVARDGERTLFVPYVVRSCEAVAPGVDTRLHDVSSPQGYAGILLSGAANDPEFVANALEGLRAGLRERGVVAAFLRMHPILNDGVQPLYPSETFATLGECVAMDLARDEAVVWSEMSDNHRTALRRSQRLGYVPEIVPLASVLDRFVAVYDETMNRVQASDAYRYPREYFADLAERDDVTCCVVRRDGDVAAACLFFESPPIVQAHLGGTLTAHLSASPFLLALHAAAQHARARGHRWLHLGGGVGGSKDGVFRFKAGFSPVRFQMFAARLVIDPDAYADLVTRREAALGTPGALRATGFFPAYRAG